MIDENGQGATPDLHQDSPMIINHPILGPRDAQEFVYLGDASLILRPDGPTASPHRPGKVSVCVDKCLKSCPP